jgi:hypothetical protein
MDNKKSYTAVMPIKHHKTLHSEVITSRAAARILTNSNTLGPRRKRVATKTGWGKIQQKTDALMKKKKDSMHHNMKRKTLAQRKKEPVVDRRHRITAHIDEIRAEQSERLYQKEKHKKLLAMRLKNPGLFVLSFTIHPKSTWKQIWDISILLLVVFSAVYIPLTLAFPDMQELSGPLQASFDFLFLIDFAMCFRTGYIRPDNEVEMVSVACLFCLVLLISSVSSVSSINFVFVLSKSISLCFFVF